MSARTTRRSTGRKVHIFWGDDRFVPADDAERNDKQAREALLDHVDIPAGNVHAMAASDGEFGDDLDAAALDYEGVLAATAEPGEPTPAFDVHLLGMGGEGHINSLFPHTPAVAETDPTGRRRRGLPQTAAPADHADPARRHALARSVAGGVGRGQGRRRRRGHRRRQPGRRARGRCGGPRGHGLASRHRGSEQAARLSSWLTRRRHPALVATGSRPWRRQRSTPTSPSTSSTPS